MPLTVSTADAFTSKNPHHTPYGLCRSATVIHIDGSEFTRSHREHRPATERARSASATVASAGSMRATHAKPNTQAPNIDRIHTPHGIRPLRHSYPHRRKRIYAQLDTPPTNTHQAKQLLIPLPLIARQWICYLLLMFGGAVIV